MHKPISLRDNAAHTLLYHISDLLSSTIFQTGIPRLLRML